MGSGKNPNNRVTKKSKNMFFDSERCKSVATIQQPRAEGEVITLDEELKADWWDENKDRFLAKIE